MIDNKVSDNIITASDEKSLRGESQAAAKAAEAGLQLIRDSDGRLTLTDGVLTLCADLSENIRRLKPDNLSRELLVRTAKLKKTYGEQPLAIDATAGFGEDSLLLAAAGFRVILYEYNTVIAVLLEDALVRAKAAEDMPLLKKAAERMRLVNGDSIDGMQHLQEQPDVILLDPMFPAREKTGLIKKKFQLLQRLEQPCVAEADMLEAAISAHPHKIVIKRPLKGPELAGRRVDYSIKGKAIRYDCIVIA